MSVVSYKAVRSNPELFKMNHTYKHLYENIFSPILSRYKVPEEEKKYIFNYYVKGVSAIVMTWISDDFKMPQETIIRIIKECVGYQNEGKNS